MIFFIRQAGTDADWDFFFKLSFETLRSMANRRPMYDQLVEANPGTTDTEVMAANRKEMEEYTDFSDPKSRVFIAKNEVGEYCGYLWMGERNSTDHWDFQKPQWIYDIVVDPKFRGNGLGKLLMREAEEFALQQDRNLGLFVHGDNESAINLYISEGYIIKDTPMSRKLAEKLVEPESKGYLIREGVKDDIVSIKELGLRSFRRMVKLSKDIADEQIQRRFDEYHEEFERNEREKSTFVLETSEGVMIGYILVGVSGFSDKVGLIYDAGMASGYKNDDTVRALVSRTASWCVMNDLSTLYYLLHVQDDISQQDLQHLGFAVPGFFMEKVLVRSLAGMD